MGTMLWVDHESYCGPDRRRHRAGLRMHERRRDNLASPPPPLSTAMRQLRLRVLDAHGAGMDAFITRAHGVATLARAQGEHATAAALLSLATMAAHSRLSDVRPALYEALDRAHAALEPLH